MGDRLRDHYNQEYKSLSAVARYKARAAYVAEAGPGGKTLRAWRQSSKKGYRPSQAQSKMNLDG